MSRTKHLNHKVILTKRKLYSYAQQIAEFHRTGSVMAELLKGKIEQFYSDYSIQLDSIQDDIKKIEKHFFVLNEDGSVEIEGEGQDAHPIMLEGKSQYSFDKNWNTVMNQAAGAKFTPEDYIIEPEPSKVEEKLPEVVTGESDLKIVK